MTIFKIKLNATYENLCEKSFKMFLTLYQLYMSLVKSLRDGILGHHNYFSSVVEPSRK